MYARHFNTVFILIRPQLGNNVILPALDMALKYLPPFLERVLD